MRSCCDSVSMVGVHRASVTAAQTPAPLAAGQTISGQRRLTAPQREARVRYTLYYVERYAKLLRQCQHGWGASRISNRSTDACAAGCGSNDQRPRSFDRAPTGSACAVHAVLRRKVCEVAATVSAWLGCIAHQ